MDRPRHTSRSWTDNGLHHNVRTTSYESPGLIFEMQSMSVNGNGNGNGSGSGHGRRGQRDGGLLGAGLGLLGAVLGETRTRRAAYEGKGRRAEVEDEDTGYEADAARRRPKSIVGAFAEKLLAGQQQRQRRQQREREQVPRRRDSGTARSRESLAEEQRRPGKVGRQAYVDDSSDSAYETVDEDDDDDDFVPRQQGPRRAFTTNDASFIQALENEAECQRGRMKQSQKALEAASARPGVRTAELQHLLDELRAHEKAYKKAKDSLRRARDGSNRFEEMRRAQHHQHSSRQQQPARSSVHDPFANDPFSHFFQPQRRTTSYVGFDDFDHSGPFGNPFAAFEQIFHNLGHGTPASHLFFGMPGTTFTFVDDSPRASAQPRSPYHQPTPSPPTTLLTPSEAARLFKTYNDRWTALPANDPNIPYPTRTLRPTSLSARNTLCAPSVSIPVSDWSDEAVMQANAQAFFLGSVGMAPTYSDDGPTGRVTMGFDRRKATAEQVGRLVEVLKKEKGRWHSDRLGRRNGGREGVNGGLAGDGRARAVFHGVCELMEFANGA